MDAPEGHELIKAMWEAINAEEVLPEDTIFTADYKALNLLVGQQGHSSSWPCPFCYSFRLRGAFGKIEFKPIRIRYA